MALFWPAPHCLAESPLFTATYKGKYSGWNFEMTRKLMQTHAHQWQLLSESSQTFASINEYSDFTRSGNTLQPLAYHYSLKAFGISKHEQIEFDWEHNKAFSSSAKSKESPTQLPLTQNTLDPALYQLKIQQDFAQNSQSFTYHFIKRKDIKHYTFKQIGQDSITLNNKTYPTLIIERQDAGPNRNTQVWLLKEFPHLIARIQHREKPGDTYTIELKNFEVNTPALKAFYNNTPTTP